MTARVGSAAFRFPILILLSFLLAACGAGRGSDNAPPNPGTGEPPPISYYSVRGSVSGLTGSGLILRNNGGDSLAISANGAFSFPTQILSGTGYAVSVYAHPAAPAQTCTVANGSGTLAGADVTNVVVSCATHSFAVGGSLSGLAGGSVVLQNNGGTPLTLSADGPFQFPDLVADGGAYAVSVQTHPSGRGCAVQNGTGIIAGTDINGVAVVCTSGPYTISGRVDGLAGTGLQLANNGETIPLNANGEFAFPTQLPVGADYNVTIAQQPAGAVEHCTVSGGQGQAFGPVDAVRVSCVGSAAALYPLNGAGWNDYIQRSGGDALAGADIPCTGAGAAHYSCLHGGELRMLTVSGPVSCEGLSAVDSLGAFQWQCRPVMGGVRMISSGLRDAAGLSDLIDFDRLAWRDNQVLVYRNGELLALSPSGSWWANPIVAANAGGSLDQPGTVYAVTVNPNADYTLAVDRIALLVRPGVELIGAGDSSSIVYAASHNHLWLEGQLLAYGEAMGLNLNQIGFSVLRHVGVATNGLDGNCVRLQGLRNSRVHRLRTEDCIGNGDATGNGVWIGDSRGNLFTGIVSGNNLGRGVSMSNSPDNVLIDVLAHNNRTGGLYVTNSHHNVLHGLTVVNNVQAGLTFNGSDYNAISNLAGANNNSSLYLTTGSDYNVIADIASTNNRRHSVVMGSNITGPALGNYFTGELRIGHNESSPTECLIEGLGGGLSQSGLIHLRCSDTGADGSNTYGGQSSDAILRTGVTQANSYAGRLFSGDARNGSDTGAAATPVGAIYDWTRFENAYRAWGVDGGAFPSHSNAGSLPSCSEPFGEGVGSEAGCVASGYVWQTAGRIWDWRLSAADSGYNGAPALRGVLPPPGGNDALTHTWSDASSSRYLRRAVELIGDGAGNDNGLCEVGERCLYSPNIGAYQGEGTLVESGAATSGEVAGVQLLRFEQNGR